MTALSAPALHGGRRAYILDDEPEICELIARIVGAAGFVARTFSQSSSLEVALSEAMADIIVLDLSLGSTDGIEVIRSLAALRFGGAILLMSGRHDPKTIEEVRRIGNNHGLFMLPFLQKPFTLAQFKDRLRWLPAVGPAPPGESVLENALRNNQLELWYQPKINLKSRKLTGAEALIRLRHPELGILPPSKFLPPSGDALHHPLADFVIRRVVSDWLFLAADLITLKLSINMPISIFETPEFVRNLRKYLPRDSNFPGLIVELTEDEVVKNSDLAHEVAIQLKLYNIDLAIDDVGSGYATLEQALALPFAELKIDRNLVDGCANNLEHLQECRRIVDLAHRLGATTVAEGVERTDDFKALIDIECDLCQGAIVEWPLEREQFKEWVGPSAGRSFTELRD